MTKDKRMETLKAKVKKLNKMSLDHKALKANIEVVKLEVLTLMKEFDLTKAQADNFTFSFRNETSRQFTNWKKVYDDILKIKGIDIEAVETILKSHTADRKIAESLSVFERKENENSNKKIVV